VSQLTRDLDVEKKRNESLTFKILARDEEIKKIKDAQNGYLNS
jgi:hypothetical protein